MLELDADCFAREETNPAGVSRTPERTYHTRRSVVQLAAAAFSDREIPIAWSEIFVPPVCRENDASDSRACLCVCV